MFRRALRASFFLFLLACGASASSEPTPAEGEVPKAQEPTPTPSPAPTTPSTSNETPPANGPHDPTKKGPLAIAELDATAKVAKTNDSVPLHIAYPTSGGPHPVIVIAHGFQLPASQYYGYARHLASFGYVALTADYPASFTSTSNVRDAQNLSGALDWVASAKELAGKADVAKSGVMGHSRGGKAAVLAAVDDKRFLALLALDPVDTKPPLGCDATTECPDSREALGTRALPSAFLGETTDATGGSFGQACAPSEGNYKTYRAKAASPSIEVTIIGANHMSFLDDPKSCGFTCSVCKEATAAHAQVIGLARAMTVAFFERHLKGDATYQTYLDGPKATALWVSPGLALISSK